MSVAEIVQTYMTKRNKWAKQAEQSQRYPAAVRPPTDSGFAVIMDDAAKAIRDLPEFDGWTDMEWEAFCELLPNMRKIMGIQHGEGGWN